MHLPLTSKTSASMEYNDYEHTIKCVSNAVQYATFAFSHGLVHMVAQSGNQGHCFLTGDFYH